LISGKSCCEFINLYPKDGTSLAAHIVLTPLTGGAESHTRRCKKLEDLETCIINNDTSRVIEVELWGVMTIRSASVVGNAKGNGIGIFGVDRIVEQAHKKISDSMRVP
jgi:hypothetical protein